MRGKRRRSGAAPFDKLCTTHGGNQFQTSALAVTARITSHRTQSHYIIFYSMSCAPKLLTSATHSHNATHRSVGPYITNEHTLNFGTATPVDSTTALRRHVFVPYQLWINKTETGAHTDSSSHIYIPSYLLRLGGSCKMVQKQLKANNVRAACVTSCMLCE